MSASVQSDRMGAARRAARTARRAPGYERDGLATVMLSLQRQALAELRLCPSDRFLDVGCATGAAVRLIAHRVRLAAGVDRCPAMISRARALSSGTPAQFAVADARALPFPTGGFTALLSTSLLHYLDDPAPALWEMVRVVDIDGRIVIGHLDRPGPPTSGGIIPVAASRRMITPLGPYRITVLQPTPDPARHRPNVRSPSTTNLDGRFGGWGCWRMPIPPV